MKSLFSELKLDLTVDELFPLSDWTLVPSAEGVYGFDLFALSSKIDQVLKVSLITGKVCPHM